MTTLVLLLIAVSATAGALPTTPEPANTEPTGQKRWSSRASLLMAQAIDRELGPEWRDRRAAP